MKFYKNSSLKFISISIILGLSLVIATIYIGVKFTENTRNTDYANLKLNNQNIKLKIVDDDSERGLGLSNILVLPKNEGMLFIFPDEEIRSFWMKDMNFNIDVIFLDRNKKIISIYENVSKEAYNSKYPEKSEFINSILPTKYVIELNAFDSDRLNLKIGKVISI